jgi:micrococcal nuclease
MEFFARDEIGIKGLLLMSYLPDAKILNYEVVKAGMAWWFKRFAPKEVTLEGLEYQARQQRRRLWSDPAPKPPWEFRKSKPLAYRE